MITDASTQFHNQQLNKIKILRVLPGGFTRIVTFHIMARN